MRVHKTAHKYIASIFLYHLFPEPKNCSPMLWDVCLCIVAAAVELSLDSYIQEILSDEETRGHVER